MATLTGTRGADNFPIGGYGAASDAKLAYGTYALLANPAGTTIIQECWVPKNSRVVGGWLQASDIDTGTEALDMDFGWEANGDEIADPDGFGNFGVWVGDAVTDFRPEAGNFFPLGGVLFTAGPKKFNANTRLSLTVNTTASAGYASGGQITAVVFYLMEY